MKSILCMKQGEGYQKLLKLLQTSHKYRPLPRMASLKRSLSDETAAAMMSRMNEASSAPLPFDDSLPLTQKLTEVKRQELSAGTTCLVFHSKVSDTEFASRFRPQFLSKYLSESAIRRM